MTAHVDVRETLPRSVLTEKQQRRLAALQGARAVLGHKQVGYTENIVDRYGAEDMLRLAKWIEGES